MKKITRTIAVNEVMKGSTLEITITGIKIFKIRMFIGIWLIKLAAWIICCPIELSVNEDKIISRK